MTTLTVHLDEKLLAKAEAVLARRRSTVNEWIEETLSHLAEQEPSSQDFGTFLRSFAKYDTGGPFTGDELNER